MPTSRRTQIGRLMPPVRILYPREHVPEMQLLAYAYGQLAEHGLLGIKTEAEKMIMLAAMNLVECIALAAPTTKGRKQ